MGERDCGLFIKVLHPHEESDVTITCQNAGAVEVRFFCHRRVLQRRCSLFASEATMDGPTAKRRRTLQYVEADDDIVFEVLRFVYCGTMHFPRTFSKRLREVLAVVELLGIEEAAERTSGSLWAEPGFQQWLRGVPFQDLLRILRGDGDGVQALVPRSCRLSPGFRHRLFTQLVEARPTDFSVQNLAPLGDGLVDHHPALVNLTLVNLAGETILEHKLDVATRISTVRQTVMERIGETRAFAVSLVLGTDVLSWDQSLRDIGATGAGQALTLSMVRHHMPGRGDPRGDPRHGEILLGRPCLCGNPARRYFVLRDGPNRGRLFLKCNTGACRFFEWDADAVEDDAAV